MKQCSHSKSLQIQNQILVIFYIRSKVVEFQNFLYFCLKMKKAELCSFFQGEVNIVKDFAGIASTSWYIDWTTIGLSCIFCEECSCYISISERAWNFFFGFGSSKCFAYRYNNFMNKFYSISLSISASYLCWNSHIIHFWLIIGSSSYCCEAVKKREDIC